MLDAIDRFGVMAVMGRPILYAGEARQMQTAEKIVNGYRAMMRHSNRAEWTQDNPVLAKIFYELESIDGG